MEIDEFAVGMSPAVVLSKRCVYGRQSGPDWGMVPPGAHLPTDDITASEISHWRPV